MSETADSKTASKFLTGSSLVIRIFWLLTVLQFVISWEISLFNLAAHPSAQALNWEINGQRRSIERRVREGGAFFQHVFQPEGMLFTYAFYAYGLIGLTLRKPEDSALRAEVVRRLEELIPQAEQCFSQFPFSYCSEMHPRGGIIASGNTNLMRAGYCLLGGKKSEIIEGFHRGSKELADCYSSSPQAVLQSFPHMSERWPVDNCMAIESLRLHDKIYGSNYFAATQRFREHIASDIDKDSGMTNAGINIDGSRADVPRGCALSWSLAVMPGFASKFATQQYDLYRRNWFIPVLGTFGIREWWPGQEKFSKISEGPVLGGVGAAASGLGIVTTRVNCDHDGWLGLCRGLESIGFPSWNLAGEKSYFGELFLMADIIAFWGKTACVWDQPASINAWDREAGENWQEVGSFQLPLVLSVVISLALLISVLFWCIGAFRQLQKRGLSNMDTNERAWSAAQLFLLVVHLILHSLLWTWPLAAMLVMRAMEAWQLRVKEIRQI